MSGLELAKQIRVHQPGIHVILMSGFLNEEAFHNLPVELTPIIQKPFSIGNRRRSSQVAHEGRFSSADSSCRVRWCRNKMPCVVLGSPVSHLPASAGHRCRVEWPVVNIRASARCVLIPVAVDSIRILKNPRATSRRRSD